MPYSTIQPPFTLRFREMSKRDLKNYFQWFQNVREQRLDELTAAVVLTRGFEGWKADFLPVSLGPLGEWFAAQVETRLRSEHEIREIADRSSYPVGVSGEELTDRTFSFAIDVGIYLSQVFLKGYPALRWNQPLGNKNDIDYGQPVLEGFGAAPFNPVRMMVTLAYGIAAKKKTGKSLRELYGTWTKMVQA
jgi:hypothetical protein